MKRSIKFLLGILLVSILVFLGYKITAKIQHKKEATARIQHMPNFYFHTLNGEIYTQDSIANHSVVFVYFNSECVYCQSEATKIKENLKAFRNTQLLFVSYEETEAIEAFAKTYALDHQKNIIFLEDKKMQFSEIFEAKTIPYTVVYNAKKEFVKKFKGAVKIKNILDVLE